MTVEELGPFDSVLDVGGNVGEFAELARTLWPAALVTSFEPVPGMAGANRKRAAGRWWVEEVALSDRDGRATINACLNQHSASSLQKVGGARRRRFGYRDVFEPVNVQLKTLDAYAAAAVGRSLLKIDVEGHELAVLTGGERTLARVAVVVCEVNQDPDVFLGAPPVEVVDDRLRRAGFYFAGVLAVQLDGAEVVQFDGVWTARAR